jgi:hypothetical protein
VRAVYVAGERRTHYEAVAELRNLAGRFLRRQVLAHFDDSEARMSVLVWVAADQGVGAIAKWHDPTGVTILVACFFCLWWLGVWLKTKAEMLKTETLKAGSGNEKAEHLKSESRSPKSETESPASTFQLSVFRISIFALFVWIAAVEISVEAWYRSHEAKLPPAQQWGIAWPTNNSAFEEMPIPATARQILRYDEGRSAGWREDRTAWQMIFLRWNPGRTALHLAQNHTPEVCLTAAGHRLDVISEQEWIDADGLRLPFAVYQVTDAARPFFVFYCLWDDRAVTQTFQTMALTYGNRLAPVLAGLRNPGERSLEIAVSGADDAPDAEAAVKQELEKLIVRQP